MLQQTQVATVEAYFARFIKQFPTIRDLAAADEQQVLRAWEGLGYYRRARQMHAAAQQIVVEHHGAFPCDFDVVLALPGIGRYTAGAILSIADDQPHPILEANTIRLFARLIALTDNPRQAASQAVLWEFAEHVLPRRAPGEFNQALMELGSLVCLPKNPKCLVCPVNKLCPTFATGRQAEIPRAKVKQQFTDLTEAAIVVRRADRILLRLCGPDQRWAGLWDVPRFEVNHQEAKTVPQGKRRAEIVDSVQRQTGVAVDLRSHLATIEHGVTRYRITLHCYTANPLPGARKRASDDLRWVPIDQLADYPLSTTGRKIAKMLVRK